MQLGSMSFVTGYENIYTTGTSLSVTGLTPSTTYYYVVRADNGSCTSANSNEISVTTNSCSGAAHIVSSILPTTGPVGTTVILKGSGFTAVTDVEIGGIVVTDYTVSDNNTIVLRIPDGATTGTIDVFNNGCPKSSGTFTVLNSNGACGGGATATVTDLMISEVYDSETGSRGYIELFNGTSASINLSNYKIKINTGAITWVSLSGTLPPNQFAVVKIGNTGTSCDASITGTGALIINRSTSSGYNKNDDIELYKGATKIDRMVTPNELGYNMERNTLTNAPSTTFTSGNWTKTSTEACSSLGNPSFTVAPLLVINTHPTDWTSCPGTVQFSVAATATPSPVTSYAWYYNDLQSMTGWQLVSGNISGASGTNTATLSLPADFAPLYNYQFYCNVVKTNGGNTCTKTTNAAVFKYPTARYYRTKTSTTNGNWATAAQWEMSNDINFVSPAPITACAYPIAVNSSAVFVQSGTKTTLGTGSGDNFDIEIDKITIDGTLEINIDSKLTVNDSTVGADMLVNGILIDRGNSTNGIDFRGTSYTNGSGWILGNAGTVIKTSTSSVVNYRDFYQGGISNIPDGSSGAQWIYRYNGDGNPSTNAVGMFYPNLYFENANAGNFAFNNNLMALIGGSGGFCTVKGNLNVGTTGVGTVTAYNNNINPQAMKVLGNMTIGSGSTFTNLSYDNTVVANTHGHGTGIELYGNLTNNGTLTNNGGNSGILRFKGSGTQTVSGSGTFNLWNVELDKPSQTIVDQLVNLTTQNNLNFVHGILKTNSNVFTVSNGDKTNAVTGYDAPNNTGMYSDDKYVFGKLERAINTTGIYDFPVGDAVAGKAYNPIQLEISSGAGNATAQFIPADMSTHTCVAGPTFFTCIGKSHFYHYTGMTGQGIWRMGSSTGTTFSYNVILHPNTKNANVNPNDDIESGGLFYKEVYRALKATNGTTDWSSYAGGGDKCTVGNYYSVPGNGYSGFSDFGIPGGSGASTPLPVELISFTGQCNDGETVLKWSTASERDSKEFLVQRSDNNRNYATIATIPSAGFSNILRNYSYIDKIANGKNYYRLMEVANNGKESTHPIIYVTCEETNSLHVYYSEPKIVVEANSTTNKDLLFNVFEVSGKLLHSEHKAIQKGFNRFELNIHATLAKGVYIIQSIDGEKVEAVKVMVH
jgi:hypothetical protein